MQLFYHPDINEQTNTFSLDKEESKHIAKVLRKDCGDIIDFTNGKGLLIKAEIVALSNKNILLKIVRFTKINPKNYYVHMVVAPTKMNDRYEWFLEKATEIGVDEITPIICDNSERKTIKPDRFEKIMQSAMKQSLQSYLPKLNPAIAFKDFIEASFEGQLFIAHCDETERFSLKTTLETNQKITLLIGPEGDFSPKEINAAITKGFTPVTLGSTRLRTETAAIVACHTVALLNQ